jgi:hypothetical protein
MLSNTISSPVTSSVRALLTGLFDFAGLFPPASLSMENAVAEYAAHQAEPDRWMTGPFVCPVGRLTELADAIGPYTEVFPFKLSLLPRPATDADYYLESFSEDMQTVRRVLETYPKKILPTMIELHAPALSLSSVEEMTACMTGISASLSGIKISTMFIEVTRSDTYAFDLETTCAALTGLALGPVRFGLKIRCGGARQDDYPSSRDVAVFLSTVLGSGCFFKATAGLHHPVRHDNAAAGATMHGFLNVFFAATIFSSFGVSTAELIVILEDEDPSHFEFVDGGIRYDSWLVPEADIQRVRTERALSIGSCSFTEPRQDLLGLGYLVTA